VEPHRYSINGLVLCVETAQPARRRAQGHARITGVSITGSTHKRPSRAPGPPGRSCVRVRLTSTPCVLRRSRDAAHLPLRRRLAQLARGRGLDGGDLPPSVCDESTHADGSPQTPPLARDCRTKESVCAKVTTAVSDDLLGAPLPAEADQPRPKWLDAESPPCVRCTRSHRPRGFVRQPRDSAMGELRSLLPVPPVADPRSRDRIHHPQSSAWAWVRLSSVEITAHRVAVEACRLQLTHDHADVLLAEVLFAVTRNRDDDAGCVAKAPMARSLAAEFGEAVIG
jgi:hypothetical protein